MNGAESLVRSLVASGVNVCFGNPGTSEMHFVASLDKVPDMRPVLALAEGVATGAADGYARMTGKPASTLLHLGPGLANGLANLHNARRAASPVVNIVGDHPASHSLFDSPITSDIAGLARPVSDWVRASKSARDVGDDAAQAVQAARKAPGQVATLILPADTAWDAAEGTAAALPFSNPDVVAGDVIERVAAMVRKATKVALLLRGEALQDIGLRAAGRIARQTGARLLSDTFAPRIQRGAGRVDVERLPYFGEEVVEFLHGVDLLILVCSRPPVSFFAYPGKPGWLTPPSCRLTTLAQAHENGVTALIDLADALGARTPPSLMTPRPHASFEGDAPLSGENIMRVVAAELPEAAIIADESISAGFPYYGLTSSSAPHDYLNLTGGAIGSMMAVSTGAAVACPDRKIVTLQGDGSAMYILQSLWTQARERLDIVTVIFANRAYKILGNELKRVGASGEASRAMSMLDLSDPTLDWVKLAEGMGVEAVRCESLRAFKEAFVSAMSTPGPRLIEAVI
jgi:acetolactate synthase I/II/III large subunit